MYRIDSIRTWLLERERQVERKASAPREDAAKAAPTGSGLSAAGLATIEQAAKLL